MSEGSESAPSGGGHGLSEANVDRLLENQSREIELRSEELDLRRQELDHGYSYSQAALEAQERDRESERVHAGIRLRVKAIAAVISGLAFVGFLGFSVFIGRDELARELVKLAAVFLGGGGIGYTYGVTRKSRQQDSD